MARQLRFMAEYGVDFVLWGPEDADGSWEQQLNLDDVLVERLLAWLAEAQAVMDAPDRSARRVANLDRQGAFLAAEVQEVVGNQYNVVYFSV